MVIVLTGGGTSGHVTPNIALLPKLRAHGCDIHYIGSSTGMERQLVEKTGIPYHAVSAGRLRRYADIRNLTDVLKVTAGFRQSVGIFRRLKPDLVFSKGGFVSCPVVWAARLRQIPVVIHESDITPGLANKLSMPFALKICYTFPETKTHLPAGKGVMTGLPIRAEILQGDADAGLRLCGFDRSQPVLMVIGGSQGARSINSTVRQALPRLREEFQVCHICGKGNIDSAYDGIQGYGQFEYVNEELPHLYAMADVVVSRAGATTLFELLSLKKLNLLIPLSKNASRGDQLLNAQSFQKQGFSSVLPEEELTAEALADSVIKLYHNKSRYQLAMRAFKTDAAADAVTEVIMSVLSGRQRK
jgi:UDP-N-acetylglucosamine--N-acetylmuramyl-(pentapeptide) pyrophosphoryl-undecaprenol N-acetylglucosamine transferase